MLVSHRKKFIYTKTVKTASTSVKSYFERYCMGDGEWQFTHARPEYISEHGIVGIRSGNLSEIQASIWWNHMPAVAIKGILGEEVWDSYFEFCVVRNPFDKLVSAFHHFAQMTGQQVPQEERVLKAGFENWVKAAPFFAVDRNKYVIDDEFCMDYVVKFENLKEDIERVCEKLDIPYQAESLPGLKMGQRPSRPLIDYYSDNAKSIVLECFKFEFDKFGYSTTI